MAQRRSIVIVGGGVFGASTAREIRKMMPDSKVTIVDIMPFPSASSDSSDYNKIIRADYRDPFYMKLALEAQELWRSDPLYQPFYHESGMLYAEKKGVASDFLRNYGSLGVQPVSEILSPQEARSRFGGAFRDSNWTGVEENYWNPRSGWGEGDAALKSLIQAGISEGVAYRVASVSSIAFDDDGSCRGVLLDNGEKLPADHVIVAAGAWTPKLLADSAPSRKDFHVGSKMVAAGAIQCSATFPSDQAAKLKSAPVMSNGMPHTDGAGIPPTTDGKIKFNYQVSFTNNEFHAPSGQTISMPPLSESGSAWTQDVPEGLKDEIQTVVKHTYGDWIEGLKIENYRICWDAVTPNQDWIIAPHPHSRGLYIASGGSFHSWKFMPVLGHYVVKMLQGELEEEYARRWAWERSDAGGALPEYLPRRDLKDIKGYGCERTGTPGSPDDKGWRD